MKHLRFISPLLFLMLSFTAQSQFRIVGYLNTWDSFPQSAATLHYSRLTHINIAFANPDSAGNLPSFPGLQTVTSQAHRHGVKVLMSLGGAELRGTKQNWVSLTQPAHIQAFCSRMLTYITSNHLDGLDVDLEGDIIGSQYANFIHTLATTLHPHGKLVTSAVATWFAEQIPATTFADFDFVNIMSYDETGPWDTTRSGPHAPYSKAVSDLSFWAAKGLPPAKTNLGVPFYGYGFHNQPTQDEYAYKDIITRYKGAERTDEAADTIYYNGIPTIAQKTKLAMHKAGGIMIWQLTGDAEGTKSLLNTIYQVAHQKIAKTGAGKKN